MAGGLMLTWPVAPTQNTIQVVGTTCGLLLRSLQVQGMQCYTFNMGRFSWRVHHLDLVCRTSLGIRYPLRNLNQCLRAQVKLPEKWMVIVIHLTAPFDDQVDTVD